MITINQIGNRGIKALVQFTLYLVSIINLTTPIRGAWLPIQYEELGRGVHIIDVQRSLRPVATLDLSNPSDAPDPSLRIEASYFANTFDLLKTFDASAALAVKYGAGFNLDTSYAFVKYEKERQNSVQFGYAIIRDFGRIVFSEIGRASCRERV